MSNASSSLLVGLSRELTFPSLVSPIAFAFTKYIVHRGVKFSLLLFPSKILIKTVKDSALLSVLWGRNCPFAPLKIPHLQLSAIKLLSELSKLFSSLKLHWLFLLSWGYPRIRYACAIIFADSSLNTGSWGLYPLSESYLVSPFAYIHEIAFSSSVPVSAPGFIVGRGFFVGGGVVVPVVSVQESDVVVAQERVLLPLWVFTSSRDKVWPHVCMRILFVAGSIVIFGWLLASTTPLTHIPKKERIQIVDICFFIFARFSK